MILASPLTSANLSSFPNIAHGFFGAGTLQEYSIQNVSTNASLTHGAKENVYGVRAAITQSLHGTHWVSCQQSHSNQVLWVTKEHMITGDYGNVSSCDAMITQTPGIALGIMTADCLPILLYDPNISMIAAIHSGWRGTFSGAIDNTLKEMRARSANDIYAAIGPSLQQRMCEVGPEFKDFFHDHTILSAHVPFEDVFAPSVRAGHFMCDLPRIASFILKFYGVKKIDVSPFCTYSTAKHYALAKTTPAAHVAPFSLFSYRYHTHAPQPIYGCQASAICLRS